MKGTSKMDFRSNYSINPTIKLSSRMFLRDVSGGFSGQGTYTFLAPGPCAGRIMTGTFEHGVFVKGEYRTNPDVGSLAKNSDGMRLSRKRVPVHTSMRYNTAHGAAHGSGQAHSQYTGELSRSMTSGGLDNILQRQRSEKALVQRPRLIGENSNSLRHSLNSQGSFSEIACG